ncbi:unnamed protein product, partial [Dovyalis caffra]
VEGVMTLIQKKWHSGICNGEASDDEDTNEFIGKDGDTNTGVATTTTFQSVTTFIAASLILIHDPTWKTVSSTMIME